MCYALQHPLLIHASLFGGSSRCLSSLSVVLSPVCLVLLHAFCSKNGLFVEVSSTVAVVWAALWQLHDLYLGFFFSVQLPSLLSFNKIVFPLHLHLILGHKAPFCLKKCSLFQSLFATNCWLSFISRIPSLPSSVYFLNRAVAMSDWQLYSVLSVCPCKPKGFFYNKQQQMLQACEYR